MNKYASGYTLIQILSAIGWLIILISVVGGIFIASNAERGMGWVGISVGVAGSFQGLLLLGMGAIGTAILDGSLASQHNVEIKQKSKSSSAESISESKLHDEIKYSIEMFRFVVASSLGKPGFSFVEISHGVLILRSIDGKYFVNDKSFDSLEAARFDLRKNLVSESIFY